MSSRIDLHIEHLVVEGLAGARLDGRLFEAAIRAELTRLLGGQAPGAWSASLHRDEVLAARPVSIQPRQDADTFGMQIAHSVHSAIQGEQA